ncbi:MAG: DUF4080 domain-containing protein [Bacilli bacterium]|nr:DUF4080 domain-containing protein [Bacilli bacterium]
MKTLLIGINSKYIHPALAIYQLAKNTTYDVTTKEFTIKDQVSNIFAYIKEENPTLVGFSVYIWNIQIVKELSMLIKENLPNTNILYGGPEVSYDADTYLLNNYADYIIYSEGEESFHLLLDALNNNRLLNDVPNLSYLENNTVITTPNILPDLNKIKLATLDVKDFEKRIVYLESSRGCPYRCSYCVASTSNKVRMFPLPYILDILKILMEKETKTIKFLDRTFNADTNYLTSILDFIEEHNISTTFQFEIVIDRLTKELIEKIGNYQNSNLRFEIGIQSTNDVVNKSIRRHQNMDLVKENILLLNQYPHITLHVDLIAGLPFEDLASFRKSFNETFSLFAGELQLGFLKFLKGTHLMTMILEHGYIYDQNPPYEIIENKYISKEELQEIHKVEATLEKFYNSNRFKNLWEYIKNNNLITDYYQFFLDFYNYLDKLSFSYFDYQVIDLFNHFDDFLKSSFLNIYNDLHEMLIIDYYSFYKVKPKLWRSTTLSKEEKAEVYPVIVSKLNNYTLEDLYRYALVLKLKEKYFVIIYQNHQNKYYFI